MVHEVEPKGADSPSTLPRQILESGIMCMDDAVGVGNPLHYHKMSGEVHVPEPPRSSPLRTQFLRKCTNLPQIDNNKASFRTAYTRAVAR